jgi:hypothetical protein
MYEYIISILPQAMRLTVPILFAGLGGVLASRSGVLNIGLEGSMLVGALAGVIGSYLSGNPWLGLLLAILAGGIIGIMFDLFALTLGAPQAVVGAAINIFSTGITAYVFRIIFATTSDTVSVNGFSSLKIPVLGDIPLLGEIFFDHNVLMYLAFLLVLVMHVYLYYTTGGLNLRSCGENSKASDSVENMLIAAPTTACGAPKVSAKRSNIIPIMPPASIASSKPNQGLPDKYEPITPARAPTSIEPSRPILSTPERLANTPPRPAKRIGTVKRIACGKMLIIYSYIWWFPPWTNLDNALYTW